MAALLFVGLHAQAQQTEIALSPELSAQINTLSQYTENKRQLRLPEKLPLRFPTRDDLRTYITEQFDLAFTPEAVAESVRFYSVFGFLPPETDLRALLDTFYTSQVGGFYDTDTRTMNVVLLSQRELGTSLPLLERIVYVHEYVHALQDAAFDLDAYLTEPEGVTWSSDEQLARLALVEGDATLIMNEYAMAEAERNPLGTLLGLALGGLQAGNLTLPPGIPDIIADELLFPYLDGEVFVRYLYQLGGWQAVNAAFDNPPASTEHILHPERYIAGDLPQIVLISDHSARMGSGWALADAATLGEFYLRQYLARHLGDQQAATAAAGWGGDAYHIYANGDQLALAVRLAWDSAQDHAEFSAALASFAASETGAAAVEGCYSGKDSAVCVADSGFSYAPTLELAQALVQD
jgi:hypothetical protein